MKEKDKETKGVKSLQDQDIAISVSGISKTFYISRPKELRKIVITSNIRWDNKILALDNIDFSINKGECIGIVGNNGSGKSTLLRIISGIMQPDSGKVRVSGKMNPVVSLGAGTYPELTGKENLKTYLTLLGISKKDIEANYNAILEFSGLKEYENLQLKHYSSGMAARLSFSCVIHVDADVYLFDETFAVGDRKFQEMCFGKIRYLKSIGKTIIMTSHSPMIIRDLCSRALLLHKGKKIMIDEADKVMDYYEKNF